MYIAPGQACVGWFEELSNKFIRRNYEHTILCLHLYQAMKIAPKMSPLLFLFPNQVFGVIKCLRYKGKDLTSLGLL